MESHKLGTNVLTLFYVDAFNWSTFVNQDLLQFKFFSSNIACFFSIGTIIKTKLSENDIAKLLKKLILFQWRYITSNKFTYQLIIWSLCLIYRGQSFQTTEKKWISIKEETIDFVLGKTKVLLEDENKTSFRKRIWYFWRVAREFYHEEHFYFNLCYPPLMLTPIIPKPTYPISNMYLFWGQSIIFFWEDFNATWARFFRIYL